MAMMLIPTAAQGAEGAPGNPGMPRIPLAHHSDDRNVRVNSYGFTSL